jgi:hypothetical protein
MNIASATTANKITLSGDFLIEVSFSDVQASTELRLASQGSALLPVPSGQQLSVEVGPNGMFRVKYFNGSAWSIL